MAGEASSVGPVVGSTAFRRSLEAGRLVQELEKASSLVKAQNKWPSHY